MLSGHRNTRKQGDVGLGSAIAYFTSLGNTVCVPLTDSQRYDLIVERDNTLYRVQVKTTNHLNANGVYETLLKTCGGNKSSNTIKPFDNKACELLFILSGDGARFLIPTSEVACKTTLSLGKKYSPYKI